MKRTKIVTAVTIALALGLAQNPAEAQVFPSKFSLGSLDGSNGFRANGVNINDYSGRSVSAVGDINGDGIDDLLIGADGVGTGSSYVVFGKSTAFDAMLELSSLDGTNGFRLDEGGIGRAVSAAGDVNGDGIDDMLIGDRKAGPNGRNTGSSYVVFGKSTAFAATLDLSSLDGTSGFRLDGQGIDDFSGTVVSDAGDVNGDGLADLLIGAENADPNGSSSGSSYVVFGKSSAFTATLDLSTLDGTTGFRLDGVATDDLSGSAVSAAGDVNGDGFGDLLIGAKDADPNGDSSGSSYVVFGKSSAFTATFDLSTLDGTTGFRLDGVAADDLSGNAVSAAGDINNDGFDDLLIGAKDADPNGDSSGSSYVVFGKNSPFNATLNLSTLDGTTGFRLDGVAAGDESGNAVSEAGDVNGDGIDDLLIGAPGTDQNGGNAGSSYLVYGNNSGFSATLDLSTLDGTNGFTLEGPTGNDRTGTTVSAAGDVNNDGIDDLLFGVNRDQPNGNSSGSTYVVFGRVTEFNSDSIDFGDVFVDQNSGTQSITVENTGTVNLNIDSLDISGINSGDFALTNDNCSSQVIAPASTCIFDVELTPSALGARDAQLDIQSIPPSSSLPLSGDGVQSGVALMPDNLDFGDTLVGQTSDVQNVSIENTGTGNLAVGSLSFSGSNAVDFALTNDDCSNQLIAPQETCSFDVSINPSALGLRSAQVDIPSNAPSISDVLPVSGNGVQSGVGMMPSSLDFGGLLVGQPSATQSVSIENTGTGNLELGSLSFSGSSAVDFALTNDVCSNQLVAPQATCSFDVSLTPSAAGTRSAQVDIPSNAPSSSDVLPVSGNGLQPAVGIMPGNLDFNGVTIGQTSAVQSVSIENTGNIDLNIGSLSISGSNSSDFVMTSDLCSNQLIVPQATCSIEVELSPSVIGSSSAQVDIPSNAPSSSDVLPMSGNGLQVELYVNANAVSGGDGQSWVTAFNNLQDALAIGISGMEIWVAQGVYYPDVGGVNGNDDRMAAFQLKDGVSVYGGFIGTETELSQRNPELNVTVLSGDIEQDDINLDGNNILEDRLDSVGSNSYQVVYGSLVDTSSVFSGFTITAGQSDGSDSLGYGAGMYCGNDATGPSIIESTFIGNYSQLGGAGTFGCSQNVRDSKFINNYSNDLAMIYASGGYYENVLFQGNTALGETGALLNETGPMTIVNSKFISNQSVTGNGGALFTFSEITLENVLFSGNKSGRQGGALYLEEGITASLTNVTMTGNHAVELGGAIRIPSTATLNLRNSIIWNNNDSTSDTTATSSINLNGGNYSQTNSLVQNFGTDGVGNLDEDPLFRIDSNPSTAPTTDGNARLMTVSIAIDAGDDTAVTTMFDLDGEERIQGAAVDMGAYEFVDLIYTNGFE